MAGEDRGIDAGEAPARGLARAMLRGALHRCPACGAGRLYRAYLKVEARCPSCAEELHHQRADDAPPYVTVFVVGHLVVAAALGADLAYAWPLWLHAAVWGPATIALCLLALPVAKGALVGLQWALRMHGFDGRPDGAAAERAASARGDPAQGRGEARRAELFSGGA